jgi:hypothetical protein
MAKEPTPSARVAAAVALEGESAFVARCIALLDGSPVDTTLVDIIGGTGAEYVMSGHEGGPEGYWPRTWALRALLYAWDPSAEGAIIRACQDEAWRVREMAAKVLARRKIASLEARRTMTFLLEDDNTRVVRAAARAMEVSSQD